jgi:hypothetical protein
MVELNRVHVSLATDMKVPCLQRIPTACRGFQLLAAGSGYDLCHRRNDREGADRYTHVHVHVHTHTRFLRGRRGPEQGKPGHDHDGVHHQAERFRFELQHEALGDEGAEHERGAGDQAL